MTNTKFRESIHSSNHALFRELLTNKRKASGLSQRQLAEILDEPRSFVSKVEVGDRRLDFIETLKYCQAINLSPYVLVDRFCIAGSESLVSSPTCIQSDTNQSIQSCVVTISFEAENGEIQQSNELRVQIDNHSKASKGVEKILPPVAPVFEDHK